MPSDRARAQLRAMVEALRHESFYSTGTWADQATGVYTGWTARKGSFSDGMPLFSERGNLCLVFSGEEYPKAETVSHLKARGHCVAPEGPSYLVHLCEEDPCFPKSLLNLV